MQHTLSRSVILLASLGLVAPAAAGELPPDLVKARLDEARSAAELKPLAELAQPAAGLAVLYHGLGHRKAAAGCLAYARKCPHDRVISVVVARAHAELGEHSLAIEYALGSEKGPAFEALGWACQGLAPDDPKLSEVMAIVDRRAPPQATDSSARTEFIRGLAGAGHPQLALQAAAGVSKSFNAALTYSAVASAFLERGDLAGVGRSLARFKTLDTKLSLRMVFDPLLAKVPQPRALRESAEQLLANASLRDTEARAGLELLVRELESRATRKLEARQRPSRDLEVELPRLVREVRQSLVLESAPAGEGERRAEAGVARALRRWTKLQAKGKGRAKGSLWIRGAIKTAKREARSATTDLAELGLLEPALTLGKGFGLAPAQLVAIHGAYARHLLRSGYVERGEAYFAQRCAQAPTIVQDPFRLELLRTHLFRRDLESAVATWSKLRSRSRLATWHFTPHLRFLSKDDLAKLEGEFSPGPERFGFWVGAAGFQHVRGRYRPTPDRPILPPKVRLLPGPLARIPRRELTLRGHLDPAIPGVARIGTRTSPVGRDGRFSIPSLPLAEGLNHLDLRLELAGVAPIQTRLEVVAQTLPPPIRLRQPLPGSILRSGSAAVRFQAPGAYQASVNGVEASRSGKGLWEATVTLSEWEAQSLEVVAQDDLGNSSRKRITIRRLGPESPAWLAELSPERRPPALPAGLRYSETPAHYVNRLDGTRLVWIPPGSFVRGGRKSRWTNKTNLPRARVTFASGFFCATQEVSRRQYARFCMLSKRLAPKVEPGTEAQPATSVTWHEALAYAAWAGLSLPSEAAWDYAGGGVDRVARTEPNAWGVAQIDGRVQEWVLDCYGSYRDAPTDGSARDTWAATARVVRGASPHPEHKDSRLTTRAAWGPEKRLSHVGFRLSSLAAERPQAPVPPKLPPGVEATSRAGEFRNMRDGSVLIWIPAGTYRAGSTNKGEAPAHSVEIREGFFLGKFEVSRGQFAAFCQATKRAMPPLPSSVRRRKGEDAQSLPMGSLAWADAQAYAAWAGLRLPSEAEWEFACRAGSRSPFGTGAKGGDSTLYTGGRTGSLRPLGKGLPNAWGFHALEGNLSEWVQDHYSPYKALKRSQVAREDPSLSLRVRRGGNFGQSDWYRRAAYRCGLDPSKVLNSSGMRVALSLQD